LDLEVLSKKKEKHIWRYVILSAVTVVFLVSSFFIISANNKEKQRKQKELDFIKNELMIQEQKNIELSNYANYSDEEYMRYVIEKAHGELDYVRPGERIFKITPGE